MENKKNILINFVKLLYDIEDLQNRRDKILDNMFWEYNNLNIHEFEDTITKFRRYFPERRSYPSAFLASSLGFNKSNYFSKYNEILQKFNLHRKPRVPTLKNALHFERLKILLIKYFDLLKK